MTFPGPGMTAAVLVVDDDPFEADYVVSVLRTRRVSVLGPVADPDAAIAAAASYPIGAAVLGLRRVRDRAALVALLERRGVPRLLLSGATGTSVPAGQPVLARPFAAFQVADWVSHALASEPVELQAIVQAPPPMLTVRAG